MDTKVSECENICPKCSSININYESINLNDVIYYPATCKDCGCKFKEYYTYAETEWED